ncbi:MAG: helix-turn-helix domain-containing protein [Propionicimonas sp.]
MSSIVSARSREYLSIDGAAERLGVSPTTIRRCISGGQLRAFRTGKRLIRIRIEDLEGLFCEIPTAGEYGGYRKSI